MDTLPAAQALRRAAVRAESRALSEVSIEIREESRALIENSKLLLVKSRVELARLRESRALAGATRSPCQPAPTPTAGS